MEIHNTFFFIKKTFPTSFRDNLLHPHNFIYYVENEEWKNGRLVIPEKEKSTGTLTTKVIGKEQLCETWVAKLSASSFFCGI
jgi:hypothetical protein